MVTVDLPGTEEEKAEAKKKAAAERQRKSRAKKKASTASSKQTVSVASNMQMKVMLMTLSGILASRPGMEVWALSNEEAEQIVTPLAGIMAKSNIGESVGEYADHIALAIACFTIFIPKFLMWQATKPNKKEVQYAEQVRNTERSSNNQTGTLATSSGTSNRQHTDNLSNVNASVSALIPASIGI